MKLRHVNLQQGGARRKLLAVLLALGFSLPGSGHALMIPVSCGGVQVGNIEVEVDVTGSRKGVVGDFTSIVGSPNNSLQAAATACSEDHFNWYQLISGNIPSIIDGGPQIDPLLGGQLNLWADNLGWYWNETVAPASTTLFVEPDFYLSNNINTDTLLFYDYPFGHPSGTYLSFSTWLVSLNSDGSWDSWHEGFSWCWGRSAAGVITVCEPAALGEGIYPRDFSAPEPGGFALFSLSIGMLLLTRRRN